jgi:PKD repeat protein
MKNKLRFVTAACLLLMLLAYVGPAAADYPPGGMKPDGSGGYMNPDDGMCVVGVKLDGTMLVDWAITKARDCVAYTTGLTGMTTQAQCVTATLPVVAPNDGYRHTWATSNVCIVAGSPSTAISLVDLDRTAAMCLSKGGTTLTSPGTCVAYGWVYRNRKADNTLPISGAGISTTDGVQATDNLGFCYASMRMTSVTFSSATTCPSKHNSRANADPVGGPYTEWPTCLSSTTGCQTQASYDAGLGWSWDATNSRCLYAFGLTGIINAAATKADGTTYAAASTQNPSAYTNQGDCLANGFSWDNWLPSAGTITKDNTSGGEYAGMPAGAVIRKLDALTPVESGGGEFFSGTGFNCQKCHADQSRAYQERNKPGFVLTRHMKAGDAIGEPFQPNFTPATSDWGLQGVQCAMCHSTARPAQDDLIQVVPAGVVGPPAAGAPKSATGHNQTEYGAHLLDICFHCHGNFPSANAGNVVPVTAGDFSLTPKGLAPIGNQFLNSPHAKYVGTTSDKVDIGNKTKYGSSFEGYVCRTSNSVGGGSIITTVYQSGTAKKIPNLDSTTNLDCTNPGDGSGTSGAAGFWVKDGETSPGNPSDTAQGNCMTCHDVHWALADTNPEAEPFRRECTTCHSQPVGETSAANAAQIDLTKIRHPGGGGTPLADVSIEPAKACEICHMPKSSTAGSPMHLWRISTDASYATMGATQANTAPAGSYTNAAWVDLDFACGQCHGGSSLITTNGAPYITKALLASYAVDMHKNRPTASFTAAVTNSTKSVTVDAFTSLCSGDVNNCDSFSWAWGDASTTTVAKPTVNPWLSSHVYVAAGTYTIQLTVSQASLSATASRTITITDVTPPAVGGTCTFVPNTWKASVIDSTSSAGSKTITKVVVNWGDGTPYGISNSFPVTTPIVHTYLTAGGPYTVKEQVIDSGGMSTTTALTCTPAVAPAYFTISGTVKQSNNTTLVPTAVVKIMNGATLVKSVLTNALGAYTATLLKPGTYTVVVTKTGYTFGAAPPATVGASQTVNINSLTP